MCIRALTFRCPRSKARLHKAGRGFPAQCPAAARLLRHRIDSADAQRVRANPGGTTRINLEPRPHTARTVTPGPISTRVVPRGCTNPATRRSRQTGLPPMPMLPAASTAGRQLRHRLKRRTERDESRGRPAYRHARRRWRTHSIPPLSRAAYPGQPNSRLHNSACPASARPSGRAAAGDYRCRLKPATESLATGAQRQNGSTTLPERTTIRSAQ